MVEQSEKVQEKSGEMASPPPAAPAHPVHVARNRRAFLVDGSQNILAVAIIEALVIVALVVAWAVTIVVLKPEDRVFALTADKQMFAMSPLSSPNMTNSALVAWAAQAITDVMTVSVGDYDQRQIEHEKYFTPDGWKSFSAARKLVGERENVLRNRQVITAAPRAAPSIVEKGLRGDSYFWRVQVPMVITYNVGNSQQASEQDYEILVLRVSTSVNTFGVGIDRWQKI